MDYQQEYEKANTWHRKACLMSLFHTSKCMDKSLRWTLRDTAVYFGVSIGLVSENIKLAKAIDSNPNLIKAENRAAALKLSERRAHQRIKVEDEDWD